VSKRERIRELEVEVEQLWADVALLLKALDERDGHYTQNLKAVYAVNAQLAREKQTMIGNVLRMLSCPREVDHSHLSFADFCELYDCSVCLQADLAEARAEKAEAAAAQQREALRDAEAILATVPTLTHGSLSDWHVWYERVAIFLAREVSE
jgi:hypothetical protein